MAAQLSCSAQIPWNAVKKAWRKARQAWRRSVTHGGEGELAAAMLELRRSLEGAEVFACDAALEACQSRCLHSSCLPPGYMCCFTGFPAIPLALLFQAFVTMSLRAAQISNAHLYGQARPSTFVQSEPHKHLQ